jgi:hypothetical protein
MSALKVSLTSAMKQLQEEFLAEAQQKMLTSEGKQSLHDDDINDIASVITVGIVGGAYAAMDEFGKGSSMDMSNPALQDYMNGPLWNPARGSDPTIRSRSRGTYTNIFGQQVESRSNIPGINLEEKDAKYAPSPPSHAIQTAARWMENGRIQTVIKETISAFPFSKFIIANKD